jgi:hypothetical protein
MNVQDKQPLAGQSTYMPQGIPAMLLVRGPLQLVPDTAAGLMVSLGAIEIMTQLLALPVTGCSPES